MKKTVSAVLKAHLLDNSLLEMTREALFTIKPYVDELIIIDHASAVGGGWLRSEADIYIRNNEPGGFPVTVQQGMGVATGDYVAILNNDIKFRGDWVTPLVELFDDEVAIVHPKMLGWGEKIETGDETHDATSPKDGLFFSAFMLNPKLYKEVGEWDTDYEFWGYDDWDYFYRTRLAGMRTV